MTAHEHMLELAVAALDFPLSATDARLLNEHVRACEACRRQASAMRDDHERLAGGVAQRAPEMARQRVLAAALDAGGTMPLFQRPMVVLAAAVLLMALAVAGVAVGARVLEFILDARLPVPTAGPIVPSSVATASAGPSAAQPDIADAEWIGYRRVLVETLAMRAEPRADSRLLTELSSSGTIVSAWSASMTTGGEEWQLVHYGDLVGWVVIATPGRASPGPSLGEVEPGYAAPLLRVDIYPDVIGPQGTLTFLVEGEGRLIRPDVDGYGWTEQWLTAAGMDLLDAALRDSGLLEAAASYPPDDDWQGGFSTTRISVYGMNGPLTVEATSAGGSREAEAVVALGDELVALVDAMPDAAVVDPAVPVQPYRVAAYDLLIGLSQGVLATWPDEQVTAIPLWLEDATLPLDQPLLEIGDLLPGQDLRCSVIDAESAAALREALWAAGYEQAPGSDALASFTLGWRETNGVVTVDLNAVPPGETADCARYGAEDAAGSGSGCVESPDLAELVAVTDPVDCYGSLDLVIEGWLDGIGAYDPVLYVEPSWLCCPQVELSASPDRAEAGGWLWLVASPESGIDLVDFVDGRVRITGHFDDPAAMDCEYTEDYSGLSALPGDAVLGCRQQFVVTALEVLES